MSMPGLILGVDLCDDYSQISFNIHEDGSETWNVTQWNGIN